MGRELIVPEDCDGMRLDQFVVAQAPGASRRKVRDAAFRLNHRPAKHGVVVRAGDVVDIPDSLLELERVELLPNYQLAVAVLYSDEDVVAVDKPAGMQSVALRADETGTLANYLVAAFPDVRAAGSPLEGGLVQRLDEETSGVLLAARSAAVHRELRRQFSGREVRKEYLALVAGRVDGAGKIEVPIAHHPVSGARMLASSQASRRKQLEGRPASTEYEPVLIYRHETLLRVTMRTGVRHQIRVHLASLGHPILGDRLYGATNLHPAVRRMALHASKIQFRHPTSGAAIEIDSPIPEDFEAAVRRLKP